jgi:hypothetical protein
VPALAADAFVQQIRKRKPEPVYVIIGDDDQEKTGLAQLASDLVEEELRAFNVERLYGTDRTTTADNIVEAARMLPMLGDRRLIVVLRADRLLKPPRKKADEDAEAGDEADADAPVSADALTAYVTRPEPMTTLVLVADDIDRSRKLGKAVKRHGGVIGSLVSAGTVGPCHRRVILGLGRVLLRQSGEVLLQGQVISTCARHHRQVMQLFRGRVRCAFAPLERCRAFGKDGGLAAREVTVILRQFARRGR